MLTRSFITRARTRVFALVGVLVVLTGPQVSPAHAVVQQTAGACVMVLEVDWGGPSDLDISTPSVATCVIDGEMGVAQLNGPVDPIGVPFNCVRAVGETNTAYFEIKRDSALGWMTWSHVDLRLAKVGDVVDITLWSTDGAVLVASGEFVQQPASVDVCQNGSNPVTWTGALVFEDPVLEDT